MATTSLPYQLVEATGQIMTGATDLFIFIFGLFILLLGLGMFWRPLKQMVFKIIK